MFSTLTRGKELKNSLLVANLTFFNISLAIIYIGHEILAFTEKA